MSTKIQAAIESLQRRRRPITAVMVEMEIGDVTPEMKAEIAAEMDHRAGRALEAIDLSRMKRERKRAEDAARFAPVASRARRSPSSTCYHCGGPCADGSGDCGECH